VRVLFHIVFFVTTRLTFNTPLALSEYLKSSRLCLGNEGFRDFATLVGTGSQHR